MPAETIEHQHGQTSHVWLKRIVAMILPIAIIVGGIAAFIIMGILKPKPEEKEDVVKAIPVLTAYAQADNATLSVFAQGEVQPRTQINIVPQISGKITYMSPKFIEGGQFKKGDLLIRIEPKEYELGVIQAKANVAQAETALTREKSEAEIARKDWEELNSGQAPSPLTLREPQMAEAAARLESSKAQLEQAKLQLSRTSIYAPFPGRVTMRHVNQGEFVTIGTRIGEVYSTDVMDVRLPLTNQDMAKSGLKLGYIARSHEEGIPVNLSANVAGENALWSGRIVRTDSGFDPKTRVLFAYAEVKDPFGAAAYKDIPLAPGLFVNAEIEGESLSNILTIPRAALRGKDTVYIAENDDTLRIVTVDVASSNRESVIIIGGLQAGARVITSPIRGVADKMKIDIVEPETNASVDENDEIIQNEVEQ